jgi:hypothetical protein
VQKQRATFTLDPDTLRATRVAAARAGKRDSEVVEEALRQYLLTGFLEPIWARNERQGLTEEEAMELALSEQRAWREEQRRAPRRT